MDESPNDMSLALRPYRRLIDEFISGAISADAFERDFLARYLADETLWDTEVFDILDGLFADVDDYVSDPELRSRAGGLDGEELGARARATLQRLDALGEGGRV